MSSAADGSSVYFATTLRLKNSAQPRNGKIFAASQDGVSLFRARETAGPPANSPACAIGGFADYLAAETSSGGVVALTYRANGVGSSSYPANPVTTQIVTASGETNLPGIVRLSSGGRYAIVFLAATLRPSSSFTLAFLDLQTGVQSPVPITGVPFPEYVQHSGGRVIANDGMALLAITDGSTRNRGYLLKPGVDPQPFPIADGLPLMIDAAASKVVYRRQSSLYLLDLRTLQSTLLGPSDKFAFNLRMSDDAGRLLYLSDGQVHVLDTATLVDRPLTDDPAQIGEAAISGDGKFVHAVTRRGRLLKINVDDGSTVELIGHTPYLQFVGGRVSPGFVATIGGSGLSDSVIDGTPPFNAWLGNVSMWIGERKVKVVRLTPTSVSILVPWDVQPEGGSIRIQAEAPGEHTPFYFPEVETEVEGAPFPRAGAVTHQNWQQFYVGPVSTGEVIHVFAVGFGPVSPEVPEGAAAPSAEPFSRLSRPLTCANTEILYAGLTPFSVERIYQIDIRIGPTPGYQQFTCTLGNSPPFIFLTLNVVRD